MTLPAGYPASFFVIDQLGAAHMNGAPLYDVNERDCAPLIAQLHAETTYTASGAIGMTTGTVILNAGSALAMTLAAPVSGPFPTGQDGNQLTITSVTAQLHTVTTPANKINGNKLTSTFSAAAGNSIDLRAFGGVWYCEKNVGSTLS